MIQRLFVGYTPSKVLKTMELAKSWDLYNHLYGLGFYMGQHAGPTVESQGQIILAPQKAVDGANPKFPPTHPKTGVGDKQSFFFQETFA